MMTYLAIYFAIGIIVASVFGADEGLFGTVLAGFFWPLFLLWVIIMIVFNLGR